jgi:hypothetical protein
LHPPHEAALVRRAAAAARTTPLGLAGAHVAALEELAAALEAGRAGGLRGLTADGIAAVLRGEPLAALDALAPPDAAAYEAAVQSRPRRDLGAALGARPAPRAAARAAARPLGGRRVLPGRQRLPAPQRGRG